jgi:penicillin V acylase-like amidase (Ntn superfamily)
MKISKLFILFFAIWALISSGNKSQACSMYKITVDGKTMVGCNEDAWRTISRIWFVNAKNPNEYGAAFTGSRQVGSNKTAPQSGMNEAGLAFSRLGAWYPTQENPFTDRIKITSEVAYLTDILQKCANIERGKSLHTAI